jgi:hypothetical protein
MTLHVCCCQQSSGLVSSDEGLPTLQMKILLSSYVVVLNIWGVAVDEMPMEDKAQVWLCVVVASCVLLEN